MAGTRSMTYHLKQYACLLNGGASGPCCRVFLAELTELQPQALLWKSPGTSTWGQ